MSGIAALVDMSGLAWTHWRQLSLDYISCMVATVQGAFPIRCSSCKNLILLNFVTVDKSIGSSQVPRNTCGERVWNVPSCLHSGHYHLLPKAGLSHVCQVRPFLTEKIRKRLQFHGGHRQDLLEGLGKEVLPKEYGGEQVVHNVEVQYSVSSQQALDEGDNVEEAQNALASLSNYCSFLHQLIP